MPKLIHLAFDLSFIHMEGRWRMPGSWVGRTFPDVGVYEDIARIAERGCLDMLFSGMGQGCQAPGADRRMRRRTGASPGPGRT